jgi:hypothetical protein
MYIIYYLTYPFRQPEVDYLLQSIIHRKSCFHISLTNCRINIITVP